MTRVNNILVFYSDINDAIAYHRLVLPGYYMKNVKFRTAKLYPQDMEWADVLIISRVMDGEPDNIRKICNDHNVRLIIDVDDYWRLPGNHVLSQYYQKTKYGDKQEAYLRVADQVWTTNETLASEIRPFNSSVHIFPNAIPFGEFQFTEEREPSDRVRYFYAGGHTHRHDIALLSNVCRMIRKNELFKQRGQFVLAGGHAQREDIYVDTIWADMERNYSGHAPEKATFKRLYSLPVDQYMDLYKHADVGLVALEDNRFTRCKSNLKILECASKRIPVIISDIPTYRVGQPPVLFARNDKDFIDGIGFYLDATVREQAGEALYQWAFKHHNLKDIAAKRMDAVKMLNCIHETC